MFIFIESSIFERVLPAYLDDDEYSDLQQFLMQSPEAGELVPGSGGVRKVRWSNRERGSEAGFGLSISSGIGLTSSGCSHSTQKRSARTCPRISSNSCWRHFEMGKKLTGKALANFEANRDVWRAGETRSHYPVRVAHQS